MKIRRVLGPAAKAVSAKSTTQNRIVLYTRQDCPLCDLAQRALDDFCRRRDLHYTYADISEDSALMAKFASRVPVVCVDDVPVCVIDFDSTRLEPYFTHT